MVELGFALQGVVFGLAGGLAPGPLTALVIGQTLRFGPREGIKVAFAPMVTDGPMMALAFLATGLLAGATTGLGVISLVGAAFLAWLAWDSVQASHLDTSEAGQPSGTLGKAVLTNLLNPHPYLFWFTVGGPLLVDAAASGPASVLAFVVGFMGCLVGAKVVIALALGRYRHWFAGAPYRWTMRVLGLAMLGFAFGFVRDGGVHLGWW